MPDNNQDSNPFANPTQSDTGTSISLGMVEGDEFDGSSTLPTDGVYHCRCVAIARGPSKAGNDMLTMTYSIVNGDFDGDEVMDWVLYNRKNTWRIAAIYKAFGIKITGQVSVDSTAFLQKDVNVKLERKKDRDGQPTMRVVHPLMNYESTSTEPFRGGDEASTQPQDGDIPF